jgi:S1-C subfamily serine protease
MPYVGTDVVALAIAYTDEPASKPKAKPKMPDKTFGTCFAVSEDGKLATAEHVVRDARSISVQFEGGDPIKAAVWARDEETDIAILDIDEETPNHLVLADASVATSGDRVFTFGFPVVDLLGQEPKFTDGAVSSLSGLKGEKRLMQITVPIQPGNSGGPVVTERGLVIGIITSTVATTAFFEATGSLPQGINWAVKAEHARVLLEAAPAEHKKLKRKAAVRLVRKSVCAVIVENQKHTND